jgi:hypothetical protein
MGLDTEANEDPQRLRVTKSVFGYNNELSTAGGCKA